MSMGAGMLWLSHIVCCIIANVGATYVRVRTLPRLCCRFLYLANCRCFSATIFDMIITKRIWSLSMPVVTQIFSKQVKTPIVCLDRGSNLSPLMFLNLTTKSLPAYSSTWECHHEEILECRQQRSSVYFTVDNDNTTDMIDSRCRLLRWCFALASGWPLP